MKELQERVIKPNKGVVDLRLNEILNYKNLLYMLVKRDFITHYKQTILGPLWYLIQPMISALTYLVVFGNLAKLGTDSVPQVLFYFSGTILWTLFTDILLKTAGVFSANKDLFGKVYFPRIIVPISYVVGSFIKLLIQFALFIVMYVFYIIGGATAFNGVKTLMVVLVFLWIALLAVGMGLIVSSITTKYRDIAMALNFVVSLLMYVTPVVYPASEVHGKMRYALYLNPLTAPLETFRYSFFDVSTIPVWAMLYSVIFVIVIIGFGLVIFSKNEKTFIDII